MGDIPIYWTQCHLLQCTPKWGYTHITYGCLISLLPVSCQYNQFWKIPSDRRSCGATDHISDPNIRTESTTAL